MALTDAERQQKRRSKLKNLKTVSVRLTRGEFEFINACFEEANDYCDDYNQFRTRAVLVGCMFLANSGHGKKFTRKLLEKYRERDRVTKE